MTPLRTQIKEKQLSYEQALRALDRALEALSFYADENSWEYTTHESSHDGVSIADLEPRKVIGYGPYQVGGKLARHTIQDINSIVSGGSGK